MKGKVWEGVNTFHKSVSCAERNKVEGNSKLISLKEAIDKELTPCGICLTNTKHGMNYVASKEDISKIEALSKLEWFDRNGIISYVNIN